MDKKYVLSLDQGTTSSRAILFDRLGHIKGMCSKEFRQIYPQPGWVEHDPAEILESQLETAIRVIGEQRVSPEEIAAIGITNQRETAVLWDKETGVPVYNAIVWQCRRSAEICEELRRESWDKTIKEKTGLVLDAYFSATKIKWLLDNHPELKQKAREGKLLFGTIDTWLIWNLSGGRAHVTDYSNASRTMLYNIYDLCWDEELLDRLDIPREILPEVLPSSRVYCNADKRFFGVEIPVSGDAGDQQAALFGQLCTSPGMVKCTYGTGCFMLMNTGKRPVISEKGLLTTIAWNIDGKVNYALEGSVFMAGATIQWLRDRLKLINNAAETEALALSVKDTGDVYLVPAFAGLGTPHWDMYARGTIVGMSRYTGREHIVRAALESIAYQNRDVLGIMSEESGIKLKALKVDGGAVRNNFLVQFQADLLGVPVLKPKVTETTAMGAAFLAGLAVGFWNNREELGSIWQLDKEFKPERPEYEMDVLYYGWEKAVEKAKGWKKSN